MALSADPVRFTFRSGFRSLSLVDPVDGVRMPLMVFYPTDSAEERQRVGPFDMSVARDAEPIAGRRRLVVLSHGNSGAPLLYRDLMAGLARRGFVVAAPEHPFNNRNDNSRSGTVANLGARPRHVRAVADWMVGDSPWVDHLDAGGYAAIGHSIGGYTVLALAGGRPQSAPAESPDGRPTPIDVATDERLRALVLMAPALVWFRQPGSLGAVTQPLLMLFGENDHVFPPGYAEMVLTNTLADIGRPDRVFHQVVARAGHYSFMSPYPEAMRQRSFPPSQDPPGFDREAFQPVLIAQVADFLERYLAKPSASP